MRVMMVSPSPSTAVTSPMFSTSLSIRIINIRVWFWKLSILLGYMLIIRQRYILGGNFKLGIVVLSDLLWISLVLFIFKHTEIGVI